MVMQYEVRSLEQALAYMVDCTLATVGDMASKKSRPKGEYSRQISMAQLGIDWMREFGIDCQLGRAEDILGVCTVEEWAKKYEPDTGEEK